MTYKEIVMAIKGHLARQKADMQEKAVIAYRQADLIAALVGSVFGGKQRPPTIDEVFPGLFPARPKQDWRLMKARIQAWADGRRERGETNGNHAGSTAGTDKRRD